MEQVQRHGPRLRIPTIPANTPSRNARPTCATHHFRDACPCTRKSFCPKFFCLPRTLSRQMVRSASLIVRGSKPWQSPRVCSHPRSSGWPDLLHDTLRTPPCPIKGNETLDAFRYLLHDTVRKRKNFSAPNFSAFPSCLPLFSWRRPFPGTSSYAIRSSCRCRSHSHNRSHNRSRSHTSRTRCSAGCHPHR